MTRFKENFGKKGGMQRWQKLGSFLQNKVVQKFNGSTNICSPEPIFIKENHFQKIKIKFLTLKTDLKNLDLAIFVTYSSHEQKHFLISDMSQLLTTPKTWFSK